MLLSLSRNIEHFLRPASLFLSSCQRFSAQGLAMAGGAVLFRTTKADMGTHDNQGRVSSISLSLFNGSSHSFHILGISYTQHLPAIGLEACFHILGEGNGSIALDGNLVVII